MTLIKNTLPQQESVKKSSSAIESLEIQDEASSKEGLSKKKKTGLKKGEPLTKEKAVSKKKPSQCLEPEDVLRLLKQVIVASLAGENYTIALKALELWGKELGLFSQKKRDFEQKKLSDLSTPELEKLLDEES